MLYALCLLPKGSLSCPGKPRHGVFNGLFINAIGNSKISRTPKTASGYDQDVFFLKQADKSDVIRNGALGEQVEGSPWLDKIRSRHRSAPGKTDPDEPGTH